MAVILARGILLLRMRTTLAIDLDVTQWVIVTHEEVTYNVFPRALCFV